MDYLAFRSRARLAFLFVPSLAVTLGSNANPQKKAGQIVPSASMNVARAGHTATLLRDGTVLIAGGMLRNGDFTSTAETYDPKTNGFTLTKGLDRGRLERHRRSRNLRPGLPRLHCSGKNESATRPTNSDRTE